MLKQEKEILYFRMSLNRSCKRPEKFLKAADKSMLFDFLEGEAGIHQLRINWGPKKLSI